MSKTAQVMNLFIASPGYLTDERDAVEQAADAMTAELAPYHGTVIVTDRYEQMVGAAGNPQHQINGRADNSDIFVGIVHRWWGTPTGNGYSSGFFEEFSHALKRWQETGHPRIALFFKDVEDSSLRDPGAQLAQVLKFRKEVEEKHIAFYKRFSTPAEIGQAVTQIIAAELAKRTAGPQEPTETGAVAASPPPVESHAASEPINAQLAHVFQVFSDVLGGREVTARLDPDRLEFFSISLAHDDDDLPVHLVNRMYRRRSEVDLWEGERRSWLRAYLQDVGRAASRPERVIPYLAAGGGVGALRRDMLEDAEAFVSSEDPNVRFGALRVLAALKLRPRALWKVKTSTPEDKSSFQALWRRFNSGEARELALVYWLQVATTRDRPLASALSQSQDDGVAALGRVLQGLLSKSPTPGALAAEMPSSLELAEVRQVVGGSPYAPLTAEQLSKLVTHTYLPNAVIREALRELVARDEVPESVLRKALKKRTSTLTFKADFQTLTAEVLSESHVGPRFVSDFKMVAGNALQGESVEGIDSERLYDLLARLARRNRPLEDLLDALLATEHPSIVNGGHAARYRQHWATRRMTRQAKNVVTGDDESVASELEAFRSAGMKQSTLDFVRDSYVIEALDYLASVDEPTSQRFAAEKLREIATDSNGRFQYRALDILVSVGGDQDLELLAGRGSRYTDAPQSEYLAAVTRRAGVTRLRRELFSENTALSRACLIELGRRSQRVGEPTLFKLMRSADAALRLAALDMLMDSPTAPHPEELLSRYMKPRGTFYYNVVVELDRRIAGMPLV